MTEKISSRRAFFATATKALGGVALAAPFLMSVTENAQATQPNEQNPPVQGCFANTCAFGCSGSCMNGCMTSCMSSCTMFNANNS